MAGSNGPTFKPWIHDVGNLLVPSIALYEVHKRMSRVITKNDVVLCLDLMRRGRVVELSVARAIAASDIAQTHQLAMADAVMYAIAVEFNAQFYTQDVDYEGLPLVQYSAKAL